MATMASLEKKLKKLEDLASEEQEKHILILVNVDSDEIKNKTCSSYIFDCIEQSCEDEEMRQRALEQAFLEIEGKNPFDKTPVAIIPIYPPVALRTVKILEEQGVHISL